MVLPPGPRTGSARHVSQPDLSPLAIYRARVASGALSPDDGQSAAITRLDRLWHELAVWTPPARKGLLGRLLRRATPAPEGVYMVGEVGRGKSMLMDLFFEHAPVEPRQRLHFHAFMQDMHARLHAAKRANPDLADPIPPLADHVAAQARLLCFDEFQINDIADAMLLGRLFEALFARGVVMVATSNTRPENLFQDQPGGEAFRPFIAIIRAHAETITLGGAIDYRRAFARSAKVWLTPDDARATAALDAAFTRLAGGAAPHPAHLEVNGRALAIPSASGRTARFDFAALCAANLGPGDYLAIARAYDSVLIDHIPELDADAHDVARRFITLIDALYEARTMLVASAAAEPDRLFVSGRGAKAFERTASRLQEMQSSDYLERGVALHEGAHQRHPASAP